MSIAKKTVACLTATAVAAGVCAPAASAASFTVSNGQCNFSYSWNDDSMWRRVQNLTDTNAELPKTPSKLGAQGMVGVFDTVVSNTRGDTRTWARGMKNEYSRCASQASYNGAEASLLSLAALSTEDTELTDANGELTDTGIAVVVVSVIAGVLGLGAAAWFATQQ